MPTDEKLEAHKAIMAAREKIDLAESEKRDLSAEENQFVDRALRRGALYLATKGQDMSSDISEGRAGFHRSGAPVPTPENSSGRCGQMSSITGRSASSDAKKCRIAA